MSCPHVRHIMFLCYVFVLFHVEAGREEIWNNCIKNCYNNYVRAFQMIHEF